MADFHELLVRYKKKLDEFEEAEDLPKYKQRAIYEELQTIGLAIETLAGIRV